MGEVVSSIKHPAVVMARRSLGQLAGTRPEAFLAEGPSMVSQAIAAQAPIQAVFFLHPVSPATSEAQLLARVREAEIEHHLVSKGPFSRLLDLRYQTAARVLATVAIRAVELGAIPSPVDHSFCALVAEDIQDPRNAGVLVRSADAWGVRLVVFAAGAADPFSRSGVRATTGSIFRVPVARTDDIPAALQALRDRGVRIVGTSAQAPVRSWEAGLSRPCALVVGNEASGLSPEARAACDLMVAIPMSGGAHSLNVAVAAGILLYEMERQSAHASLSD